VSFHYFHEDDRGSNMISSAASKMRVPPKQM
jgi:hypothetical protein